MRRERKAAASRERLDVTEASAPERGAVGLLQADDVGGLALEQRGDARQCVLAVTRALQELVAAISAPVGDIRESTRNVPARRAGRTDGAGNVRIDAAA